MNLECLNTIITDNLAIHIDLSNLKSWNLNTGFTSFNLTKWINAYSDNINLIDFGLTEFDNGRTNVMWSGITLTPNDNLFSMYRIGYNEIINPLCNNTSGYTAITRFDSYAISAITSGNTGNYFILNGGYLQGFFKLDGFNYELLPARYGKGITIETLVNLFSNSYGIFYMMGVRAEDKYNPNFSGETIESGITSSFNNILNSEKEIVTTKKAFDNYETNKIISYSAVSQIDNIKYNVISFELTQDKHLAYKYIDENGIIQTNQSSTIINNTGFTLISICYIPYEIINDKDKLECAPRRLGKLIFYINGRSIWTIKDFPEYYFRPIINDKEKQIGAPYSISWGGGSFGLKNSWHYDYQTYCLYTGQTTPYINNNYIIQNNPLINDDNINGLLLSGNTDSFGYNVMQIVNTGNTTGNTFFIKFNHPISILSNRNYTIELSLYDNNFFGNNLNIINKASILVYSNETDVNIINDNEYSYPLSGTSNTWTNLNSIFNIPDNTGKKNIYVGLLIETNQIFNTGSSIYIKDFTYTGADILTQDSRKNNLLIEQNFNSSFIGGIQKLRVYDNGLTSQEILHNALIEANNPALNLIISKGGRIIYR